MYITYYDVVYSISNIFGTYVLYKVMQIFYEYREYNKKIEFAAYILYFICTTFMHLLFSDSILSHIAVLVFIPLLTLNYFRTSDIMMRALGTVFSIYLPIEIIVYFGIQSFDFAGADIILMVGGKMLAFIAMIAAKKKIDRDDVPPLLFWLMIFVPIGASFFFFMMIISNPSSSIVLIAGSVVLYLVNLFVFVLYQNLATYFNDKFYEKLYKSELEESSRLKRIVYDYQDEAKRYQRELKQHIHLLISFLKNKDSISALQYCKSKFDLKNRLFDDAYTGNDEIDRILNYELLRTKSTE